MTVPSIGNLDRRLMLQEPVRTADDAGGASIAWSLVAEVWAAVRPGGGGEALEGDALRGRTTHEVWLRHRNDVRPDMRFLFGARAFDIRSVVEVGGRQRFLKCMCTERVT